MNDNSVYDEFNPMVKDGRASGVTEVFQATNSYIKNNIKTILCFALVCIVLIGGFLALNVGSISSISSEVMKEGYVYNNDEMSDELDSSIKELDDAESLEDVMKGIGSLRKSLNQSDLNKVMNVTRSSVLVILSFLVMGILIQLIGVAFVTHVNKWTFKMDRGFKDITDSIFIKYIKSIAVSIIFALISSATALVFGIIGALTASYEAIVILMTIVLVLVNLYIGLASGFAHYLVTTNKYIGIGTCISTGFGITNRFIFNWIGKMLIIYIGTFVVGGFATGLIALLATGLRSPWIFALAAVPWIIATLYSTVYSQMAMCDYTNQYEYRTGRVVRDYDYYDNFSDRDDDDDDGENKTKRYQDPEARSVDDFYNNLKG